MLESMSNLWALIVDFLLRIVESSMLKQSASQTVEQQKQIVEQQDNDLGAQVSLVLIWAISSFTLPKCYNIFLRFREISWADKAKNITYMFILWDERHILKYIKIGIFCPKESR